MCKVENCNGKVVGWGFCQKHYRRFMKYGDPDDRKHCQAPMAVRFWRFVEKKSLDECWEWIGPKRPNGYGQISRETRAEGSMASHRFSWELANGKSIPDGMVVMHKCDNPSCVNPNHLSIGTYRDNMIDMMQKGRKKTVSIKGEENARSIINEEVVREIRSSSLSHAELGRKFGVSPNCIRGVRIGRTWSHVK
jgi:hypothetical protein